jgi:hypothetical protein
MKSGLVILLSILAFLAGAAAPVVLLSRGPRDTSPTERGRLHLWRSTPSTHATGGLENSTTTPSHRASSDVIAQITLAANEPSYARRRGAIAALLASIDATNAKDALEAIRRDLPPAEAAWIIEKITTIGARRNPGAALEYAQSIENAEAWRFAIIGAFAGWPESEFADAESFIASMPRVQLRSDAAAALFRSLARTNPERAVDEILSGALAAPGDSSIHQYPGQHSFLSVFADWAARDPNAAAQRARELPPGAFREGALSVVARQLARRDPEAAMAWLNDLPPAPVHADIARSITGEWVRRDFDSALRWLQNQPPGEQRDRLLAGLAYSAMEHDPKSAITLAEMVVGSGTQDGLLANIVDIWVRNGPLRSMTQRPAAGGSPLSLRAGCAKTPPPPAAGSSNRTFPTTSNRPCSTNTDRVGAKGRVPQASSLQFSTPPRPSWHCDECQ